MNRVMQTKLFTHVSFFQVFRMIKFKVPARIYSLWDTVKLLSTVCRITGFLTFSIDGKIENGKIKLSYLDIFILTVLNIFYGFVIYINYTNDLALISNNSVFIDMGSRLVRHFIVFNVILSSLINTWRKKDIWGIFKKMSKFDKEVRKFSF